MVNPVTNFPQRALNTLINAMNLGIYSPRYLNDVMKYKTKLDVSKITPFLSSKNDYIKRAAIELVSEYGDKAKLIDFLLIEKNSRNLTLGLNLFAKHYEHLKDRVEDILILLHFPDVIVREKCVEILRKVKREDLLVGLMFESDDYLIKRIKGFIMAKQNREDKGNTNG